MIDPLLSAPAPAPTPTRTRANDAPVGTPSFEAWVKPGQGQQGEVTAQQNAEHAGSDAAADVLAFEIAASAPISATSAVSALVEFHVLNPQGEREVVATPWRLMASGRLAQSLDGRGIVGPATAVSATVSGVVEATPVAASSSARLEGYAAAAVGDATSSPGAHLLMLSSLRPPAGDDLAPLSSLPSASPAAAEWLARSMKWIERDGRDPLVLLRDFRIDDTEAQRVVDGLRAFAQEQGVALDRIVVNGREFWRRPDLSQVQE